MEGENEEEGYTLTSFEPLSPKDEKSGIRKLIEGFSKTKFATLVNPKFSHGSQNSLENSTQNASHSDKQFYLNSDIERKDKVLNANKVIPPEGLYSKKNKSRTDESKIHHEIGQEKNGPSRNTRTPSSVLRRLSQLVLLEKTYPQQSQGSNNLKKYWMPDEQCKVCYECGVKFHTFRRRHHCRLCGQIFCSRCCNEVVSGHQIGYTGVFRVCIYCKKIVVTYTSSSDIENNLNQLKEDLSLVAQSDSHNSAVGVHGLSSSMDDPELNRSFDVLGVSAEEANMLKQDSFKELWKQISAPKTGLEFTSHRIRLRTYSTCFVGRDLTNWLLINRKVPNRTVALQICQGLQDLGWIEPLSERQPEFTDDVIVLYIPGPRASGEIYYPDSRSSSSCSKDNEPNDAFSEKLYKGKREPVSWLSASFDQSVAECRREGFHKSFSATTIGNQELPVAPSRIRSLSCETVTVKADPSSKQTPQGKDEAGTRVLSNTQSPGFDIFVNVEDCNLPRSVASEQTSEEAGAENDTNEDTKKDDRITAKDLKISLSREGEERFAFEQLSAIHSKHISAFLVQLLNRVGLSQSWKEIIEPLAIKVCEMVVPNVSNDDDMDIRHYVKIKKIPGGSRSDCRIVSGVVCTKNIVHKKMASTLTKPLILMLACPVDFQRVENKMASLDSLVLQEQEFLKNMVGRIVSLKPDLVLVEKTVSRLAQDMLLARGISVILNIKPKLMARISRCVEADVLPALDQGSRPRLGTCQRFKVEKFVFKNGSTKTLAFFEGCNATLGSTIVLRGASRKELAKVRSVLRFMIFVAYNSKLEIAFIMDEFGTPVVRKTGEVCEENPDDTMADDVSRQNKVQFTIEEEDTDEENIDEAGASTKNEEYFTSTTSLKCDSEDVEGKICDKDSESEQLLNDVGAERYNDTTVESSTFDSLANCKNVVNSVSFQNILDNVVLCSSPLVKYPLPYVLTPEGKRCELRLFMTGDIYWSPLFFGESSRLRSSSDEDEVDNTHDMEYKNVFIKETHPFVFASLEKDARSLKTQELLANFRAEGGRITLRKQDGNLCAPNGNGINEQDGIRRDTTVQFGTPEDKFVSTNREDRAGSDLDRETLPLLRDCFDPFLHQMIAMMFSSYSKESGNFPRPCISPWTVFMEFYARNDITLGCFLERYCFRPSYVCPNPNCDVSMVKHVRYFAHGDGAVYINMKNLESPIPGFSQILLTWSWCKKCNQVTPVVQVSQEAWRLSFAKYLELRIYATCYKRRATVDPCDHSLHQDHYQYFAFNNIVASLKYIPVKIYEVHLPPSTISIVDEERKPQFWIQHIQAMSVRVYQLVSLINDRIAALKTDSYISNCVTDIAYDKGQLDEKIKVLDSKAMLLLSPPSSPGNTSDKLLEPHEVSTVEYEILDGITLLKRKMCEYGEKWNAKLVELLQLENEKKKSKSLETKNSNSTQTSSHSPIETYQLTDENVLSNGSEAQSCENTVSRSFIQINPFSLENTQSTTENNQLPHDIPTNTNASQDASASETSQGMGFSVSSNISKDILIERRTLEDDSVSSSDSDAKVESSIGQRGFSNSSNQKFQKHSKLWATLTQEVTSTLKDVQYVEDRRSPKMKRIIYQFLPGVNFRSIPSPFPVHEHHLLPVSDYIPIVVNEREPTSLIAYTLSSPDYLNRLQKIQESMEGNSESFTYVEVKTDGVSSQSGGARSRARARSEVETLSNTSLMNTLEDDFVENYFQWSELDEEETESSDTIKKANSSERSSEVSETSIEDVKETVNERDCLKENKVNNFHDVKDGMANSKVKLEEAEYTGEDVAKTEESVKKSEGSDVVKSSEELSFDGKESFPSSSSTQEGVEFHIKHAFSDSSAKFFCIVYFGEQFRRIRKAVFPGGEEKYIRSLQYCLKWQATGGKSGSSFCKTTDDRFVIKEMSRPEAQSFLNIAPYYFQYLENAIEEKRPTLLAKILGVYRIGYNSKLTNTPVRKDLLVMDNLLYNCKVDQVFDLKGSIRSRYVMSSEKETNAVLMDENLLEMIAESPLFIRPHSKAVLSTAINNDTEFLAKHMVMDYSLLLGIEQNSSKLIVGIIDFIRTFTWDKKLEMYVKSTGILGGQGKMPTVVSPELYRERFCEAMQRYFLMIPNKWMGLGNELK